MAVIPFVGQAYNLSPSRQLDAQNCINWYLTMDSSGKAPTALLPRPALELWADDSSNYENRGAIVLNDQLYCVVDNKLYLYDFYGSRVEKGTLNTSAGLVSMLVNDNQVFISDNQYGYVYQINKDTYHEADEFFVITEASSTIGRATFTGGGLNDMSTGGEYTGTTNKKYRVIIESSATPDTFKWSEDGGSTFVDSNVPITGSAQTLNDGVQITFVHTTGHTANDYWEFDVTIDSAFYVPTKPTYDDNRGVYAKQNSGVWYISEINQFDRVNALDVAGSEYFPDYLVASLTMKEEVWLLGNVTSEPWFDVGAVPFPYERRTSLIQNYGCAAPFSAVVAHGFMGIWLGKNREGARVVLGLIDYELQILSTEPINNEFRRYERVDDAIGSTYQYNGHIFYVLTFPTADRTWVYDITTKAWHEYRCTLQNERPYSNSVRQGRFKANWILQYNDSIICGDFESGKIYKLSDDVFTDNGQPIIFERTAPHIADKNQLGRIEINGLQVDIERGKGLVTGQGTQPAYMLQISRDGGYTWGNEKWQSGGTSGEYRKRLHWHNFGTSRSWTFKLRVTDPVYRTVYSAVADIGREVVE